MGNQLNDDVRLGGLCCIFVWEWLPTVLILIFFRKIPSTELCCPIFGSFCLYFRCCCCCCCVESDYAKRKQLLNQDEYRESRTVIGSVSDTTYSIDSSIPDISYSVPSPVIQKLMQQYARS